MNPSTPLDINGKPIIGDFDFIVVGAGSSGCIVASRLSEYSNFRVLLIVSCLLCLANSDSQI